MFSPDEKNIIAANTESKLNQIANFIRELNHFEMIGPGNCQDVNFAINAKVRRGKVEFCLHVDGAEDWSWANIHSNEVEACIVKSCKGAE
jgi:hypothetical protein